MQPFIEGRDDVGKTHRIVQYSRVYNRQLPLGLRKQRQLLDSGKKELFGGAY